MDIPLGKSSPYADGYDRSLLAPMSRADARRDIGLTEAPSFRGADVWRGYEFSWLGARGKPEVAGIRLEVNADSPYFVESKSLKLYLNGFAQTRFDSVTEVWGVINRDLGTAFGAPVSFELLPLEALAEIMGVLAGDCIDDLEISTDVYAREPAFLTVSDRSRVVEESLVSHLFRSLCPVTGQPDWASVLIRYRGPEIDRTGLLKYLISFRSHPAFHETTIEQIWLDMKAQLGCEALTVLGCFQRRGGLDINPVRTDFEVEPVLPRLPRQ
ncbi:MAG: NADPH-dependent 7-cyano-7-deazaguanine reductase QueF [Pseudomonadales bacterium]